MTVAHGELWIDHQFLGDMEASLHSYLPNEGATGDLYWYTLVRDDSARNALIFNTSALWSSKEGWKSDGETMLGSKFQISSFDWDFYEHGYYGQNNFYIALMNKNRRGEELGYLMGEGTYNIRKSYDW